MVTKKTEATKKRVQRGTQNERGLFEVYLGDEFCWDSGNVKAAMTRLKKLEWIEADDDSDEPVYQITDEGKAALGLPEYRLHPSFKKALKDVVIAMFGSAPPPSLMV